MLHFDIQEMHRVIIMNIRTPRIVVAILVGMGLSASGAAMQGLFRNPMAEPYVLGMSSGAAAGASAAIVLGMGGLFGVYAVPAMAFIAATVTIFVVYSIAHTEGKVPTETLLLSKLLLVSSGSSIISQAHCPTDALRDVVLADGIICESPGMMQHGSYTDSGRDSHPFSGRELVYFSSVKKLQCTSVLGELMNNTSHSDSLITAISVYRRNHWLQAVVPMLHGCLWG